MQNNTEQNNTDNHEQYDKTSSHLRSFVERIERLEEDKRNVAEDIKEVFAEAKANGYDIKAIRQVVRIRKMDQDDRLEQEQILQSYLEALGIQ